MAVALLDYLLDIGVEFLGRKRPNNLRQSPALQIYIENKPPRDFQEPWTVGTIHLELDMVSEVIRDVGDRGSQEMGNKDM